MMELNPAFFTIDVEDYYHRLNPLGKSQISIWEKYDARIDTGLNRIYEILAEKGIKATCFFLGYMAQRHPHLVKEASNRGHEICSHGMYHQPLIYQSPEQFQNDALSSKHLLEDISGKKVRGWRSAGFQLDKHQRCFFDLLCQCGYDYDSSLLPNRRSHQQLFHISEAPYLVETKHGRLMEFPISVVNYLFFKVSMFGGLYLRFFPSWLIDISANRVLREHPLMVYIHPRELDPLQPRIALDPLSYCKRYLNLNSVDKKLKLLIEKTRFETLGEYYDRCL